MARGTIRMLASGAALMAAAAHASAATPPSGGTIAITSPDGGDPEDAFDRRAREATTASLGDRGFTILNDRDHAAYVAEVITSRSDVGTSVTRARRDAPAVLGSGVNIPLASGKSSFVAMRRTTIEIRIRKRGSPAVLWHGSAVTVRPGEPSGPRAERLAAELSQAALSAYPVVAETAISIP